MNDRIYIFLLGVVLLATLYLDMPWLVYGLITLLYFEGITNLRLAYLRTGTHHKGVLALSRVGSSDMPGIPRRFNIEAMRLWRILMATMLLLTFVLFPSNWWFMPWLLGFAMAGAGLSGLCPLLLSLRLIGYR